MLFDYNRPKIRLSNIPISKKEGVKYIDTYGKNELRKVGCEETGEMDGCVTEGAFEGSEFVGAMDGVTVGRNKDKSSAKKPSPRLNEKLYYTLLYNFIKTFSTKATITNLNRKENFHKQLL